MKTFKSNTGSKFGVAPHPPETMCQLQTLARLIRTQTTLDKADFYLELNLDDILKAF